jgi:two-component system, chemotaxis family, protein-glutamate methylesterase/glutaminase
MSVRVLIVDDSPFVREVLRLGLSRYADIEIIGEASDGKRAEKMVSELRPDVVTMDVVMPMVGGIDAIRRIMARHPTPIVVVSDVGEDHKHLTLQAMEAGAIDTFAKPRAGFDDAAADELAALLRAAARVRVRQRARTADPAAARALARPRRIDCIGVVASTGGPQTLRRMLTELAPMRGRALPPIAIVQHTAVGFTGALTSWLARYCDVDVVMAQDGKRIEAGTIVVAPDDRHLEVLPGGLARLSAGPKLGGHRPSGTLLLRSLARAYGAGAAGVVLTGMGNDGADGARAIEDAGGLVMVESPEAAIIDGMPRAALQATQAAVVAPAIELARLFCRRVEPDHGGR